MAAEEGVVSTRQVLVARPALAFFRPHCRYVVVLTCCWLAHCNLSLTSEVFYIFCSQVHILDIIPRLRESHLEF